MPIWSSLNSLLCRRALQNAFVQASKRQMSGHDRAMRIQPTRWQWQKFKDFFHFYVMLGVIPCSLLVLYANVFVGPATLSEIPEGYTPKYWEYYRHPISRWIARYILTDPQQDYEKLLHHMYEEEEKRRLRKIEAKSKALISERGDYQMYFYKPVSSIYVKSAPDYDLDPAKRVMPKDDDWEYNTGNLY